MVTDTSPLVVDAEIITRSLDDPEQFSALFDRYAATLYRYVSFRLGRELAEDLVGETFLIAFRRRHTYDIAYRDARPWLLGIATKLVTGHRRSEVSRYRALERQSPAQPVEGPEEAIARDMTARGSRTALLDALAKLSRGDRDVLLMVAWSDMTYEEAARALGIPVGTVKSRLNRARRKVRHALGGINPLEEHGHG
ncbi:RNA polymerase sigma-70 factor (ECF subfamily) [Nonomuraea fuscirosea]|uniref:RNA polymerase sigma-70 factor (ECF subfamily) n=1 Tax=Nonomuraea fuscirosea TaxID=1291556 RepID=A0A2T0N0J0_9ACTN|nr:RNA polymerase sigma factor [Nonomuraea fuscirosea]PRX65295.1 RNA polymerase sigma-70 factor (ECF subfamily) [Nonomuraea fuscirosea]